MNQQNRYPTLMDQLNQHIEDRPDLYRLRYDPYEQHMDNRAIHVYDTTRHATIQPTIDTSRDSYYDRHLKIIAEKKKWEQAMAKKRRETELADEPVLFKLCRRVSKTLTDIYNG